MKKLHLGYSGRLGWLLTDGEVSWESFHYSAEVYFSYLRNRTTKGGWRGVIIDVSVDPPEPATDWVTFQRKFGYMWCTGDNHFVRFCDKGLGQLFGAGKVPQQFWIKVEPVPAVECTSA